MVWRLTSTTRAPAHRDDDSPHLEGCDPGKHVIPFAFVCAAPPQAHAVDAEICLPASSTPERQSEYAVRHTDVRVHGPPFPRILTSRPAI